MEHCSEQFSNFETFQKSSDHTQQMVGSATNIIKDLNISLETKLKINNAKCKSYIEYLKSNIVALQSMVDKLETSECHSNVELNQSMNKCVSSSENIVSSVDTLCAPQMSCATETIASDASQVSHINVNLEETQYLDLLKNIIQNGTWENGRNGRVKSIFGSTMRFSLKDGKIPILTTKKTAWKTCLKELLWFIRGETDNTILKQQGVHIWDGNTTREFLDSVGLNEYEENECGPIYGYQWRHFNKAYVPKKFADNNEYYYHDWKQNIDLNKTPSTTFLESDPRHFAIYDYVMEHNNGIDQLKQIIDALKDPKQRTSRRLIMTAWNPTQLNKMALPPCHVMCQFNVHDGNKLSCAMYQRSVDVFLGQPFNIASYSFLTHLLAKHCGLEAFEFVYFMGNCHIYENALEACELQVTREPKEFPTLFIKNVRENINDYQVEDFSVTNYEHHDQIKVQMVA
jgi:thymidylate synthase